MNAVCFNSKHELIQVQSETNIISAAKIVHFSPLRAITIVVESDNNGQSNEKKKKKREEHQGNKDFTSVENPYPFSGFAEILDLRKGLII